MVLWDLFAKQDYHALHHYHFFFPFHLAETKVFKKMVKFYARECQIGWKWQSVDSMMSPSPLGGSKTGKNPTDRAKLGSKVHLLVDERGAPLAVFITGANEHDKWSADDLIVHIVAKRTTLLCGQRL
jgi:hypothetical protein